MKHEVLLLGDSIRMFYQEAVREALGPEIHVSAPDENCRFAAYTRNSLRHWLPTFPTPEVIHWNNGLWDTAIVCGEEGCFTPLDRYLYDLRIIARELRKTGAKVIFATTTPVHPDKERLAPPQQMRNADIVRYNDAAKALMAELGIPVNDLWSVVQPEIGTLLCDDLIHPSAAGREVLGRAVAQAIRQQLEND